MPKWTLRGGLSKPAGGCLLLLNDEDPRANGTGVCVLSREGAESDRPLVTEKRASVLRELSTSSDLEGLSSVINVAGDYSSEIGGKILPRAVEDQECGVLHREVRARSGVLHREVVWRSLGGDGWCRVLHWSHRPVEPECGSRAPGVISGGSFQASPRWEPSRHVARAHLRAGSRDPRLPFQQRGQAHPQGRTDLHWQARRLPEPRAGRGSGRTSCCRASGQGRPVTP